MRVPVRNKERKQNEREGEIERERELTGGRDER